MPLKDVVASSEEILRSQEMMANYRESVRRAREMEAARASEPRTWEDAAGNTWHYVVLDGDKVRITGLENAQVAVTVPAEVEGLPVRAIADDGLSRNAKVEELVLPDSVQSIGMVAFRGDTHLKKLVLPRDVVTFDASWIRRCNSLEELALPGMLPNIDNGIFENPGLKVLHVGPGTVGVEPGAFAKSGLEQVTVDAGNEALATDGAALYSKDGSTLVALCVPVESYDIADGCRFIAKKGFSNFHCLARVGVPDTLEELGPFAFARTGIERFEAPDSLRAIREKAFFRCAKLAQVTLDEGLETIENDAFTGTALTELTVPSTVSHLGRSIASETGLTYAGADATFRIAHGEQAALELDEAGGLYRNEPDGKHFVRFMDPEARAYTVQPGTVKVDDGAFAHHKALERVTLPEGLLSIGRGAFKDCRALEHVDMPPTVKTIEDEAFLDTGLTSIVLPDGLEHLGAVALITHGAHHGKVEPSLCHVEIGEGNRRFYTVPGLLCEHLDDGSSRVVLYTGPTSKVVIPEEVTSIAPYAFNGARGIDELCLSDRIDDVEMCGLAVECFIGHIHVDLSEPVDGHDAFDFYFPRTERSRHEISLAFSVPNHVDVESIFRHYDDTVAVMNSYNRLGDESVGSAGAERGDRLYDQAVRIIARLQDPIFITEVNKSLFDHILADNIEDICVEVARHDDRRTIDALLDLGYLNKDNLLGVIEKVGTVQDAAMTGYLLEIKRRYFKQSALDFEL